MLVSRVVLEALCRGICALRVLVITPNSAAVADSATERYTARALLPPRNCRQDQVHQHNPSPARTARRQS